jgi:hypothetical protein
MSHAPLYPLPMAQPANSRFKIRRGRFSVDVPSASLQTAFTGFTAAAERFAVTLSDPFHRRFALQYLTYLQEIVRGAEASRPNPINGRPDFRLIRNEMERLFRSHFRPDERLAG